MAQQQARAGRRRSTTRGHISGVALGLFADRGFSEVSVDDVAQAAGIARRSVFRYYASKNAIPWGDFDAHLLHTIPVEGESTGPTKGRQFLLTGDRVGGRIEEYTSDLVTRADGDWRCLRQRFHRLPTTGLGLALR